MRKIVNIGVGVIIKKEDKHFITLWFEADYISGEAKVKARDEMSEIGWFVFDNLPEPLFPPFKKLLSGKFY